MLKQIHYLLSCQRKFLQEEHEDSGFTLIELLVGLILAFLVILPLLGFVVNMMQTDRQEQAKANSEQELQAAADYITRDLQQAVYIYDSTALNNASTNTTTPGIKDQLPAVTNGVPVLVFWKRKLIEKSLPPKTGIDCTSTTDKDKCNDAFVYSLVAYYLIKDSGSSSTSPWSRTAQIGRFEIQDGVKNKGNYVAPNDSVMGRDKGFQGFNPSLTGTLSQKMNQWKKATGSGEDYETAKLPQNNILIDYIDQSTAGVPLEDCPTSWSQVPDYTNASVSSDLRTYSFYACVDPSEHTTARVFLRGNALARIRPTTNVPQYNQKVAAYFPRTRIEVRAKGTLGGD